MKEHGRNAAMFIVGIAVGIALVLGGCGAGGDTAHEPDSSNLKLLAILYGKFQASHHGRPPASEKAFKEYIGTLPADPRSKGNGIDNLFVSPRDHQPYVVLYGPQASKSAAGVAAYEQEGIDGKRWLARSVGSVELVDEARLRQLVPGS